MIAEAQFKDLMASVPAPVTVLTTAGLDGPAGTTVSAFMSLSLEPPMVLAALNNDSALLAHIRNAGFFGVNVLAHGQTDVALSFARKSDDRFAGVVWELDHGLPRLAGTTGWIVCELAEALPGGDHAILLGDVKHADCSRAAPMVYSHRLFGTNSELVKQHSPSLAEHVAAFVR